jgi:pimeloyl-ACP methyl ester carboxylesterase
MTALHSERALPDEVRTARVGDLELAYEAYGDPSDPAVLLVMGLGTQMIAWPDPFVADLVAAGRYVVRFDNRDCGLSTHLSHLKAPDPVKVLARRERAPYSIDDMGQDALGLMDALGLETADVVGASMGGYIAQALALRAPERVRSLTLIMTSTGGRLVGRPRAQVIPQLLRRRPVKDRDEAIQRVIDTYRLIGSKGYPVDEDYLRDVAGRSLDRGYQPAGYLRQLAACLTQPDRSSRLKRLTVPALVVHGLHDPLVGPSGGLALARTLRNARFVGYAGMGHDLPRAIWDDLARDVLALSEKGLAT